MDFSKRIYREEMLDDLHVHGRDLEQNLLELESINRYLGGNAVITDALGKICKKYRVTENSELTITDIGCGGGDILRMVARWGIAGKMKLKLTGYDANPHVINFARERSAEYGNIRFLEGDATGSIDGLGADIIMLSLFCHHFTPEDNLEILKQCVDRASMAVLINDLHRHPIPYYFIKTLTRLFSRSEMVKNDAPLSVRRGFRKYDVQQILHSIPIRNYQLAWKWPFRYQVILWKELPIA